MTSETESARFYWRILNFEDRSACGFSDVRDFCDDCTCGWRDVVAVLDGEVVSVDVRAALADAIEGMEDMRCYVSPYFAEKWDHDGYIARAKSCLAALHADKVGPEDDE